MRIKEVADAIKAAIRRQDWTAARLLAATPRIPIDVRTCKPPAELRARSRALRLRRRPLRRRPPAHQLNACFTHWPGGLNYYPPGEPLPEGWVRTGFSTGVERARFEKPDELLVLLRRGASEEEVRKFILAERPPRERPAVPAGRPTNPRCYPPTGNALERIATGGSLFQAAREARTFSAVLEAERLEEERRARWREYFKLPLPEEALSLKAVEGACGKKPGPWACFSRWPGGWLPYDHPEVKAHPDVWKGPTTYGVFLPECYGYTVSPARRFGQWLTNLIRPRAPAAVTAPPALGTSLPPSPGAPAPPPPGAPPPPAGEPILCCVRVPFGAPIGEEICAPLSVQQAAGRYATWPWA